jgi:hypothetical protein
MQCNNMQKGKKRVVQKNVARRGFAFTKEEDAVLCSAYLNISKDAIVGVNQNIYDYYSEHKPNGSIRSQIGLKKDGVPYRRLFLHFLHAKVKWIGETKVERMNMIG